MRRHPRDCEAELIGMDLQKWLGCRYGVHVGCEAKGCALTKNRPDFDLANDRPGSALGARQGPDLGNVVSRTVLKFNRILRRSATEAQLCNEM